MRHSYRPSSGDLAVTGRNEREVHHNLHKDITYSNAQITPEKWRARMYMACINGSVALMHADGRVNLCPETYSITPVRDMLRLRTIRFYCGSRRVQIHPCLPTHSGVILRRIHPWTSLRMPDLGNELRQA